ncbi:ImmA/IrrE family metallo-endopeptidase [Leptospira levettii]|uniref:ImmA/IrrE family metallo-endopeptidase n=1 Tax=Leptospira levettii TaxID=2023178 RepID=UPI00223C9500|nr:ImmA/IrrE family metallo-endopeptidase [Leptospira levettii]MCW7467545.1 ImmA/IrrE family metallo-endopeptidase [Leptospira levettii]
MTFKYRKLYEIKKEVEDFRDLYWQKRQFPVKIETIIERKLNIEIIPIEGLKNLDIDAFLTSDMKSICVDEKQYMDDRFSKRLLFSLAHEVGHFILHKVYWKELRIDTLTDYKNLIETSDSEHWRILEAEANKFAGNLLVPDYELKIKTGEAAQIIIAKSSRNFLEDNGELATIKSTPFFETHFGVSEQVILRRLKDENLFPLVP